MVRTRHLYYPSAKSHSVSNPNPNQTTPIPTITLPDSPPTNPMVQKRSSARKTTDTNPPKRVKGDVKRKLPLLTFDEPELEQPHALSADEWAIRKLSKWTKFDLMWLTSTTETVFSSLFAVNAWEPLVSIDELVYPSLVREFYHNLTTTENCEVMSRVKGKFVAFDTELLATILGIHPVGEAPYDQYTSLDTSQVLNLTQFIEEITGQPVTTRIQLNTATLDPYWKLLAEFTSRVLVPRGQKRGNSNSREVRLIQLLANGTRINFPRLMILHMRHVRTQDTSHYLPYGALLTKIFLHFSIPLTDEVPDQTLVKSWDTPFLRKLNIIIEEGEYIFIGKKADIGTGTPRTLSVGGTGEDTGTSEPAIDHSPTTMLILEELKGMRQDQQQMHTDIMGLMQELVNGQHQQVAALAAMLDHIHLLPPSPRVPPSSSPADAPGSSPPEVPPPAPDH